jgi:two-component system chemotaxis response regulator CheY
MGERPHETDQRQLVRRLEAMGIKARLMQGGRCVLASMPCRDEPFETLTGRLQVREVVFATLGRDRIKCLRPKLLFQLAPIRIAGCKNATAIETAIRSSWQKQLAELRSAEAWLEQTGADVGYECEGGLMTFPIEGEDRPLSGRVCSEGQVILPTAGPLSGVGVPSARDRICRIGPGIRSSVDLEIAVMSRIEELHQQNRRSEKKKLRESTDKAKTLRAAAAARRKHRILLVGPQLSQDRKCIDSLRLRDYDVVLARSEAEAIELFNHTSPELVLADMSLGRSGGTELIPSLHQLAGVEAVPVALVDSQDRPTLRAAAKRAGAVGYLTHPIQVANIATRLEQIITQPKRRRFTRFAQQLSANLSGSERSCTVISIGRGGLFLRTDDELQPNAIYDCDIPLREIGQTLRVEAEVLYTLAGSNFHGVGARFHQFLDGAEPQLIEYLKSLDPNR